MNQRDHETKSPAQSHARMLKAALDSSKLMTETDRRMITGFMEETVAGIVGIENQDGTDPERVWTFFDGSVFSIHETRIN